MPRSRSLAVAVVAGAFIALTVLALTGALGRDDEGIDPARAPDEQWNLALVGVPEAWARATGEGVVVAVVDSGVDARHPDLRERMAGSIDCVGAAGDPERCGEGGDTDEDGHGTHVAGIVLATADNGRGVAGVAPAASLLSVRALVPERCAQRPCGATGRGEDVAAGVRWAVEHGADVVNLSLGATEGEGRDVLLAAIDEAWEAGVVVVVAGPTRTTAIDVGGSRAVVVTAVGADRTVAPYATAVAPGSTALAAPGGVARAATPDGCAGDEAVLSDLPVPGGEVDATGCLVGTSMAAPHVAGALALLREAGLSGAEAIDTLVATATDLGADGADATYGSGLLDIPAALDRAGA